MVTKPPVIIVGAGLAGCFLALLLAKKGYKVRVIEKRESISTLVREEGRSFNITLYYRGLEALKKLNLWPAVKEYSQIAEGNVAHYSNGTSRFDAFDANQEALYTVHRTSLNKTLIKAAQKNPNITFFFHTECVSIDKRKNTLIVKNKRSKKLSEMTYQFLIGADGAYSTVRTFLQQGQPTTHSLVHSDWGYKEVTISAEIASKMNLREKATHTWPRDHSLLLGFPNTDGTVSVMFTLPLHGKDSFDTLKSRAIIQYYLQTHFPDLKLLHQEIITSFLKKPLGNFVTVKTSPWYYQNSIVLVGDAAHAVVPFYGQGMCAALEDCLVLASLLTKKGSREKVFARYQVLRKRNTDILAELSISNFIELRDRSRSEKFILKDKVYTLLNQIFPTFCQPPLYVLVAHQAIPYSEAVRLFNRQEKIAKYLGIDAVITILSAVITVKKKLDQKLEKIRETLRADQATFQYPIN